MKEDRKSPKTPPPSGGEPASLTPERREALEALCQRLGYRFLDLHKLDRALRHSSYSFEFPEAGPSNEQWEFLGDAVLSLAVSDLLLTLFPEATEGELTRRRASLVNARHLAEVARRLGLGECLLLGRGEKRQAGHEKPSLLADALEAVLAAVYLDAGFSQALELVKLWFGPALAQPMPLVWQDPKTALQEYFQARFKQAPTYHLVEERGPSHARSFRVALKHGDELLAEGEGPSKKLAEKDAAYRALLRLLEAAGSDPDAGAEEKEALAREGK